MNFTVVCYRPNGVDICRGCVMATSDSAFEILHEQTEEACASAIATKRMENQESEREVCDWEIEVLIDGLSREANWQWHDQDARPIDDDTYSRIDTLASEKVGELIAAKAARQEAERIAAARRNAEEAERRQIEKDRREREEYDRLRAKFGGKP